MADKNKKNRDLEQMPKIAEDVIEDIYHVKPHEGEWIVDHESEDRILYRFDNKGDAVEKAVELARSKANGKLVIHDSEGNVDKDETLNRTDALARELGETRVYVPVAWNIGLGRE